MSSLRGRFAEIVLGEDPDGPGEPVGPVCEHGSYATCLGGLRHHCHQPKVTDTHERVGRLVRLRQGQTYPELVETRNAAAIVCGESSCERHEIPLDDCFDCAAAFWSAVLGR